MSLSVVQRATGADSAGLTGSLTAVFGSNVTAGSSIIVICWLDGPPNWAATPTDTRGNTYKLLHYFYAVTDGHSVSMWKADGTGAGANTVTISNDNFGLTNMYAYEVSTTTGTVAFDQGGAYNTNQFSTTPASNNVTTVIANELLLGTVATENSSSVTFTAGSGYSNIQTQAFANWSSATEEQIVSATGTYSATFAGGSVGGAATAAIYTFADTPTPAPDVPTTLYFQNVSTISHPAALDAGTLSAALPVGTNKGGTGGTALDMISTVAGAAVSDTFTTGTVATQTSGVIRKWVSNPLGGVNIKAQSWIVGMAAAESNAAANYFLALSIYVLTNAGTVRGYIYDSATGLGTEFITSGHGQVAEVTGSAVTGVQNTDQLVVEVWGEGTQTGTTSRTITFYWAGTNEPINSLNTTTPASFVLAELQNIFATPAVAAGGYMPVRIANKYVGPMALRHMFKQPYYPTAAASSGPNNYTQNLSAGLSFTGAESRAVVHTMTASLSFTGAMAKLVGTHFTASLSFSGAQARAIVHTMTAGLSFAGALKRAISKGMTAALSFTGAFTKSTAKSLTAASLSFSGSMARQVGKNLTATLSFAGTLGRNIFTHLTAGLSFTGAQTRAMVKGMTASLSFAGAFTWSLAKNLVAASLSFTGSLVKGAIHFASLSAGLSFTGSFVKLTRKTISAGLSFTGAQSKAIVHGLSAALSFTGSYTWALVKTAFSASLSFTGNFLSGVAHFKSLSAGLSFTGSFTKVINKTMSAGLSFAGTLPWAIVHTMAAGLSFSGSLARAIAHGLTASLSFAGNLTKRTAKNLAAAGLSFTGSMTRQVGKLLSAGLSFTGAISRATVHTLAASLSFTGALKRVIGHTMAAAVSFTASQTRTMSKNISAALSFTGAFNPSKSFLKSFSAGVSFAGTFTKMPLKAFSAGLSFAGSILSNIKHKIIATFPTLLGSFDNTTHLSDNSTTTPLSTDTQTATLKDDDTKATLSDDSTTTIMGP